MSEDRLEIGLDCTHVEEPETICLDCFYNVIDQLEAQLRMERSEVDRLRTAADTVRLSNREMLSVIDNQDDTIATLREALEPFIRDYPTEVRKSGPLPPGYTSDEFDAHCIFCDQGDRRTFTIRPHAEDCPIYVAKKALATPAQEKK